MPPKLLAMFCIINVKAQYFRLFVYFKTMYERGKSVKSDISLALKIAETYVKKIIHIIILRVVLNFLTINLATISKKFMLISPAITSNITNINEMTFQKTFTTHRDGVRKEKGIYSNILFVLSV